MAGLDIRIDAVLNTYCDVIKIAEEEPQDYKFFANYIYIREQTAKAA